MKIPYALGKNYMVGAFRLALEKVSKAFIMRYLIHLIDLAQRVQVAGC